jgi:hypothetical protein
MAKVLMVTGLCVFSGSAFAEFTLDPFKGGFIEGYTESCIKGSKHNPNKAKYICECLAQGNYDEFSWPEWNAFLDALEKGQKPSESFIERSNKVIKTCDEKYLGSKDSNE